MIELVEGADDREKTASALAPLEVRSAIRRRQAAYEITNTDAESAIGALTMEMRRLVEHPLSASVFGQAASLIDTHSLRALDALQLATAVTIRDAHTEREPVIFVCADLKLIQAAAREGLQTWNPTEN